MPTPRALLRFVVHRLGLERYLAKPGDGRQQPVIAARVLLWAMVVGRVLRECSFLGVEQIVRAAGCRVLGLQRSFSNDALNYFVERLDPSTTRSALIDLVRHAKRGKAFQDCRFLGLAVDGTGAGRSHESHCDWCRPLHDAQRKVFGYHHKVVAISVVGTGLTLPFDVEPYGPGDSEYAAAQRLLRRAVDHLGPRFADYVVGDGEYATAPFLHTTDDVGLPVVARLKENLPLLAAAVRARFDGQPPRAVFQEGDDQVEVWDEDHFDPWETLNWPEVRVLRYRQHKRDGTVIQAEWLTDFPMAKLGSLSFYRIAKSRWEIENYGFNDGKNRYGMEHICHHDANSILIVWLLIALALVIERLYRLRYLHRGDHGIRSSMDLYTYLWLSLGSRSPPDTG